MAPGLQLFSSAWPYRGKGIGTSLIGAIEDEPRRLGFSAIYVSTDSAVSVLLRRGWSQTGEKDPVPPGSDIDFSVGVTAKQG
jgi:N-acetylglutamate synthase-like GNAT family acetyltransferase